MLNLDTHILILALNDGLNKKEKELLLKNRWGISAIVLWEIIMLCRLGRIEMDLDDDGFTGVIRNIHIWPITLNVCRRLLDLDFKSDPADEIIAATSIEYRIPLLTRDKRLLKSRIVPLA